MTTKKQLFSVAFALMMAIPFAVHAQAPPNDIGGTAANPDDNQQFQDVHLTTADIIVDGDLSEWTFGNAIVDPLIGVPKVGRDDRIEGDPPSEYVVHEELGGTWTGSDDQSSSLQLVWKPGTDDPDEGGLYMGLVVTDEFHENANSGWNGDSVQMMFTLYDAEFMEHGQDEFALYNFALGGDDDTLVDEEPTLVANFERSLSDFFDPPMLVDPEFPEDGGNVEVGIVRDTDAGKTYYEMRFGPEVIGLADEMKEGSQLGIAMAINDGDEDARGQTGWVGLGAHAIVFGKTPADAALLTFAPEDMGPMCDPNTLGDIDGSGDVAFADFLILSANFGQAAADHTEGDIDCSGDVAFADFLVLSANFGKNVGGAQSVPEPSGFALASLLGAALLLTRRRR